MRVRISELKRLSEILLNHIRESGCEFVDIPNDFYWFIDKAKVYDPYKEPNPSDFTLGQLSDDWNNLLKILNNENEPIGYALVWLSSIMRNVGEEVP